MLFDKSIGKCAKLQFFSGSIPSCSLLFRRVCPLIFQKPDPDLTLRFAPSGQHNIIFGLGRGSVPAARVAF